jgi:hypothetical protein
MSLQEFCILFPYKLHTVLAVPFQIGNKSVQRAEHRENFNKYLMEVDAHKWYLYAIMFWLVS